MQASVRVLILASSLFVSAQALAQELGESSVRQFMARIDAALENRDAATIGLHMAEHAMVSGTMSSGGQLQSFRMTKSQYLQALTIVWTAASSYTYERTNEKISIDGDQATVTADITETVVMDGRTLSSRAKERATVENVDGTLMLTQVVANTTTL